MTDLFKNKYRIDSARMKNWDYGWNAPYFITICVKNRECHFGDVQNGKLILSDIGRIACSLWSIIPEHFPFVKLDEFVVMPNHVHGILVIDKKNNTTVNVVGRIVGRIVETRLIASLQPDPQPIPPTGEQFNDDHPKTIGGFSGVKNPMLNDNISRIIRWYKGRCTYEIRKKMPCFDWQERFHDHVIRNHNEFERIRNYILQNPENWNDDKFYFNEDNKCNPG